MPLSLELTTCHLVASLGFRLIIFYCNSFIIILFSCRLGNNDDDDDDVTVLLLYYSQCLQKPQGIFVIFEVSVLNH